MAVGKAKQTFAFLTSEIKEIPQKKHRWIFTIKKYPSSVQISYVYINDDTYICIKYVE